jgi:hypothetical protein
LKRAAPFLFVAALPFLLHFKLFHPDPDERLIFRGDFLSQTYVWKSYALSRVKEGELPLWNPHLLGGVAFHANSQVGIFYPPTYLLLPFHSDGRVSYLALEAYQLLHQSLAGVGMILLMRALGVGAFGALASAVAFMFTGFFTTPGQQSIVLTASLLPWCLWAVTKRSWPLLAAALALMVLAGHPQVAYYGLLLTLAFSIVHEGMKPALVRLLPSFVLALGIAAVQLWPTFELASDSNRTELGYDYSTSFPLSPYSLSALVAPRGQVRLPDQEGAAPLHLYVGMGTILFAVIGLVLSENRWRIFFAIAALLVLLLSFGKDSPVYDLFYTALPGFRSFRVPYRLLGLWSFGIAGLAGLGFDMATSDSRKVRLRLRAVSKGAFLVLLVLALWAADVHLRLLSSPGALAPSDVERMVGAAHWAVLLAALNFLLLLYALWRPRNRFVAPAFVALLVIDMAFFVRGRGEHPYGTLVRAGKRPIHGVLEAQGYRSRYVTDSNLENYDMLHGGDFAGGHETLIDRHYAALLDESRTSANALSILNVKFVARSTPASEYPWCGPRYASPLPILDVPPSLAPAALALSPPIEARRIVFYWSPLGSGGAGSIELLGETRPLVASEPLAIDFPDPTLVPGFRVLVAPGNPGIRIEEVETDLNPLGLKADFVDYASVRINLHALPRAYFMALSEVPSEIATASSLSCWSVHQGIQVVDPETGRGASGYFRKDVVRLETYEPELVELETTSPRAGFLVLSDTFRPGWIAEVDGARSPILRALTVMRAVAVPAGTHRVRFTYRPASLRWGALVSLLSLLVVGAGFGRERFSKRRASKE